MNWHVYVFSFIFSIKTAFAATPTYMPTAPDFSDWQDPTLVVSVVGGSGHDIQTAINSLSTDGGVVYLQNEIYLVEEPILLRSRLHLLGQSRTGVILRRHPDWVATSRTGLLLGEGFMQNICIESLTIDGNMNASNRAAQVTRMFGFHLSAPDDSRIENVKVISLNVQQCSMGINLRGVNDLFMSNLVLNDNGSDDNHAHNIYIRRCDYVELSDSSSCRSSTGNGFQATHCDHVRVHNCVFEHNSFRGLRVAGSSNTVLFEDNNCSYNNEGGTANAYGLGGNWDDGQAPRNFSFINNKVQSNNNGANGISITASCSNGQIEGNTCRQNNGADYNILSTNHIACDYSTDGR